MDDIHNLKLTDTRHMDENMWIKAYTCPSLSDGTPLDLLFLKDTGQWAIVMTETSPYHLFLLVLYTHGKHMDLISLANDDDEENRENAITTPSNPIARAISDGLYDQNLSCRMILDEQIVGEEQIFTLVRIWMDGSKKDYVIVDGQKWIRAIEKSFESLGLKLTSFEICHENKEWNTVCCFVKCMPVTNSTLKENGTALLHRPKPIDQNQLYPCTNKPVSVVTPKVTKANGSKKREWLFWSVGTIVGAVMSYYMSVADIL